MPSYLTEYTSVVMKFANNATLIPDVLAGPRIEADTWQEAEAKLGILRELGMAHSETEVIRELVEE